MLPKLREKVNPYFAGGTTAFLYLYFWHPYVLGFFTLTCLGCAAVGLISASTVVRQDTALVVERNGTYNRTLAPGLHWVLPFFEKSYGINGKPISTKSVSRDVRFDTVVTK